MYISIIIPTYNEESNISNLVSYLNSLKSDYKFEIIVSDGGSADNTLQMAIESGAAAISSPIKGRSGQMNYGTKHARGDIFYFVHADSMPALTALTDIHHSIKNGQNCGSFRFRFDSNKFLFKINSFFNRFNYLYFRGGDQSIFITREFFDRIGGFDEQYLIMEDYEFLDRIMRNGKFRLVPKYTIGSARKYDQNTWLSVQLANLKVIRMFRKGASQKDMLDTYKKMLRYRKNAF